nr:hypothetical protein [Lachnospiraceae bacterium]
MKRNHFSLRATAIVTAGILAMSPLCGFEYAEAVPAQSDAESALLADDGHQPAAIEVKGDDILNTFNYQMEGTTVILSGYYSAAKSPDDTVKLVIPATVEAENLAGVAGGTETYQVIIDTDSFA